MSDSIENKPQPTNNPMNIFLVAILVGAALIIGVLYSEVRNLRNQNANTNNVANNPVVNQPNNVANNPAVPQEQFPSVDRSLIDPVTNSDQMKGDLNAEVFLIEYSDFDCPFCKTFHPTMERIKAEYGDQVTWVYRHLPLPQLHPNATIQAEASECVAELGGKEKFWTFAELLFEKSYTSAELVTLAGQQGINTTSFKTCLDSGRYSEKVSEQANKAQIAGVRGTPGTILLPKTGNGKFIGGAYPYEQIKVLIDEALVN